MGARKVPAGVAVLLSGPCAAGGVRESGSARVADRKYTTAVRVHDERR